MPWLGYLDKVDSADVFVLLDTVQFEKNGWQNRNRIATHNGWMWLTVPVMHSLGLSIAETEIDNRKNWGRKHLQSLITNYSKTPFFKDYRAYLEEQYSKEHRFLSELSCEMFSWFISTIGIETRIETASLLEKFPEDPNERLAALVASLGGDIYLAGSGSRSYLDEAVFSARGIEVVFQDYTPEPYRQLSDEFEPGLAAIDALANIGPETLDVIRKGRRTKL